MANSVDKVSSLCEFGMLTLDFGSAEYFSLAFGSTSFVLSSNCRNADAISSIPNTMDESSVEVDMVGGNVGPLSETNTVGKSTEGIGLIAG